MPCLGNREIRHLLERALQRAADSAWPTGATYYPRRTRSAVKELQQRCRAQRRPPRQFTHRVFTLFRGSLLSSTGYLVEELFGALGIIPAQRDIILFTEGPSFNYTTVLNIVFLGLAAVLVWRFLRTGGPQMLRMMRTSEHAAEHHHEHASHVAV